MLKIKRSIIFSNLKKTLEKRSLQLKYLADFFLILLSYWMAYFIRFEGNISFANLTIFAKSLPIFAIGFIVCDIYFGLAKGMWRYISIRDLERIVGFVLAGNGLSIISGLITIPNIIAKIPRSIYIINSFILFLGISGARVFYRIIFEARRLKKERENILIIGDQNIAASLQSDILKDQHQRFKMVGFVTFDRNRLGSTINATPVIGLLEDVPNLVRENNIKYIFIAVDSASNTEMKKIIRLAQQSGALVRIVPTILDVVNGRFSLKDLREIRFEDYLDRKPVEFDMEKIKGEFYKKTILVTGGGGSIGTGICKGLMRYEPAKLIVLDISENNLFRVSCILDDICKKYNLSDTEIIYNIADINDKISLQNLFETHKTIDYVVHAAAHKHVPLSEANPVPTIIVNVCGTFNLITFASQFNVEKFVYISTDKAVEPVSVMGATKRLGELLIKSVSKDDSIKTKFMAVRFGNVIGSSGNVVEIFTEQLRRGVPLTITDPEMERYFMSLDEAAKLILQAISMGEGGEIFVLNMGKTIKIKNLAYDIALFYGKHLKEEDIVYTGKRKGERLSERLFSNKERRAPTHFNKIFRAEEDIDTEGLMGKIQELCKLADEKNEAKALEYLFSLASSFR